MNDCIFCKIIKGDIPSYTVYENDDVKAFLDTNPNADGHVLVVPKTHYENLFDTPDEMLTKMIDTIKTEIYPLLKEKVACRWSYHLPKQLPRSRSKTLSHPSNSKIQARCI